MRLSGGSTPTDGLSLGTLPTGYRPPYDIACATQNGRGNLYVQPDGNVSINANPGQTLNNYMAAIISYPV